VSIDSVDGNGFINGGDAANVNGITISGTTTDSIPANLVGQTVMVTLNGQNYQGTVQSDGSWQVTVGAAAVGALSDGQSYAVTASVIDKAGNKAISSSSVTTDETALLTINPIDGNGFINGGNAANANGIVISGSTTDSILTNLVGQTVMVTLNGESYQGTVQADGTWQATVNAAAVAALADGQSYLVTASVTDKAGNSASNNASVTGDEKASITVNPIDGNSYINGAQAASGISIAGTIADSVLASLVGQTVTVTLNGQSYTGTVQSDGSWSVSISPVALLALAEASYQITASVTDKAGNTATFDGSVTIDGAQYVWVGPIAGSWDVAANWNDTTAGLNPAAVPPGSNDNVTINAAVGSAVQVISGTGASASLTINGQTSLVGNFTTGTLTVNNALTVNSGDTLTVTGNATVQANNNTDVVLNGTLTAGSVTMMGNAFIMSGGTLTTDSVTMTGVSGFNMTGSTLTAGNVTASGSNDSFLLNSSTLSITGNVADSDQASYQISNHSTFTVGGTFSALNDDIVAQTGSKVQLAAIGNVSTLDLSADRTSSVEIGTVGGVAAGSISIDNGVSMSVVSGSIDASNLVDNGTILIEGLVNTNGLLSGSGQIDIGNGATFIASQSGGTAGNVPTINFEGSGDTLTLFSSSFNASQQFTPILSGFNASDIIDYRGAVTSAVYNNAGPNIGTLTLYDNSTVVGSLTLGGDYSGTSFYAAAILSEGAETLIGEVGSGSSTPPTISTPTINDTAPKDGDTLTASATLGQGDTVSYQWFSSADNYTNPIGTGATYVVKEGDEGFQIVVKATATNDNGVTASATSAVTAAVLDAAPSVTTPTIDNLTPKEGDTLTASATPGQTDNAVSYQWFSSADNYTNPIGTGASYVVKEGDEGFQIEVKATVTNDNGLTVSATSTATAAVLDVAPTVSTPTINDTAPKEGDTLTASATPGQGDNTVSYQWFSSADNYTNPIGTGASYVVKEGDEGFQIEVKATVTNDNGVTASATSAVTVLDAVPTVSTPTINDTAPKEGDTLTASATPGQTDNAVSYQWFSSADNYTNPIGTGASYVVKEGDEGFQIEVKATVTNDNGVTASATSADTAAVLDAVPTVSTPTINDTAPRKATPSLRPRPPARATTRSAISGSALRTTTPTRSAPAPAMW
jgi:hypothetical protein